MDVTIAHPNPFVLVEKNSVVTKLERNMWEILTNCHKRED